MLLLVDCGCLLVVLVGAEALRTRSIHDADGLGLANGLFSLNLGLNVSGHDAASEDAVGCWAGDLCLVSLVVSHATLGSDVHVRTITTSLVSMEHDFTLVVSATFIVQIPHANFSNGNCIRLHVILVLVCKLSTIDTGGVLSSVTVLHLSHVFHASLLVGASNSSSSFLYNVSLLEATSSLVHLLSSNRSGFDSCTTDSSMECSVSLNSIC